MHISFLNFFHLLKRHERLIRIFSIEHYNNDTPSSGNINFASSEIPLFAMNEWIEKGNAKIWLLSKPATPMKLYWRAEKGKFNVKYKRHRANVYHFHLNSLHHDQFIVLSLLFLALQKHCFLLWFWYIRHFILFCSFLQHT